MEQRLIKGMYGTEFQPASKLFDIRCGQCREREIAHNGGWYNRAGEKLGWGDLNAEDMLRIANSLEDSEIFIVLPESESFWNFVTHNPGPIGSHARTASDAEAPGVQYVAKHARYMVVRHKIYDITSYSPEGEQYDQDGVIFTRLRPESVMRILAS